MTKKLVTLAMLLAATAFVPANAGTDGTGFATGSCAWPEGKPLPGSGAVHVVGPADVYPIPAGEKSPLQTAIDAAAEGDTILLEPGVYKEAVHVQTPGLRIRGMDRNAVIFDGGSKLEIGIAVRPATNAQGVPIPGTSRPDRVVLENMTGHNYVRHAFFYHHVTGYWARFLTAYNNGLYGVYAFDSRCGQIDNSYGSGNADSAFYIGECFPCDAVITNIVAEENALGYSGTNAGGNLILRDSIWNNNAMGIVPNSLDGEDRPPQRGIIIKNNIVSNNNNKNAPGVSLAGTFWGAGIVIAGGSGNIVYGNTVTNNALGGIALAPLPDDNLWIPSGNTIWGNTVSGPEGSMDLAQGALSGPNNCWADNKFGNSAPAQIEQVYSCGMTFTPPGGDARVEHSLVWGAAGQNGRVRGDWKTWPAPAGQLNQPDANGDSDYANDGAIEAWLPALGL